MAINPETLLNWTFDDVAQEYTERDAILYALGLGLGKDPLNTDELRYVYEKELTAVPTFAVTLSTLGLWVKNPDTGITWTKLVHSGQNAIFHKPLPAKGSVIGKAKISQVYDRGAEKGAIIIVERSIYDADTNDLYCTLEQTLMLRADGGFDGEAPPAPSVAIPDRTPDKTLSYATTPGQAIIYRLSGDWNPLHIDPEIAKSAGFPQPILHGYCSYGIAGWAACLATSKNTAQLKQLECQFTGPVIPGDELTFQFWSTEDNEWVFNAKVKDRVVLNKGRVQFEN
ncbi:MAG: MaoC family dehydratase N-terminal domain-containing protein [Pseudomonadales bacterium]|nr:MaoC family dehydratase N-terminal domain-containing protein [Pseudomonadales bacterium]